jgi:hypothetical protein
MENEPIWPEGTSCTWLTPNGALVPGTWLKESVVAWPGFTPGDVATDDPLLLPEAAPGDALPPFPVDAGVVTADAGVHVSVGSGA